jgi:hypothetical protein
MSKTDWQHGYTSLVFKRHGRSTFYEVKCKFCGGAFSGQPQRLTDHARAGGISRFLFFSLPTTSPYLIACSCSNLLLLASSLVLSPLNTFCLCFHVLHLPFTPGSSM